MSKVSAASSATVSGGAQERSAIRNRSDRDACEDQQRDPVAYWYADALSRR